MSIERTSQQDERKGLPRPPLYTDDYITMAEALEFVMEQFGKLVLAIMYYTANGTVPDDLPHDLKVMFSIYQKKIDFAREKYERKCAVNAENGAKGGTAKAENAKKRGVAAAFKPPTLKQFRDAVRHFAENEEISSDIDDYEIDVFFDRLKSDGWAIGGAPVQTRKDWESAILAKFYDGDFGAAPRHLYYPVFTAIFANHSEEKGDESADSIAYDFMETFNAASKEWIIGEKKFSAGDWKSALAQFMKQHSECSGT